MEQINAIDGSRDELTQGQQFKGQIYVIGSLRVKLI